MDKHAAKLALQQINLTEFAKRSRVPLRTLTRLKSGIGEPNKGTLMLLALDLDELKRVTKTQKAG